MRKKKANVKFRRVFLYSERVEERLKESKDRPNRSIVERTASTRTAMRFTRLK